MARHAVVDRDGLVQNVIEWDGLTKWTPPDDHFTVAHEQVGRGDIWDEKRGEFLRPLALMMLPEDETSLKQRAEAFQLAKEKFKSGITIINDNGLHESI